VRIRLLRNLEVQAGNGTLLDLGSPTARSLFAYLVLNQAQSIDRRRLAFLFWPRGSEQAARRNLRQYLHRIRRSLEPIDAQGRLLLTEGNNVRFCPPDDYFLDVVAFETAASPPKADLLKAIEYYTGDLLEDIYDDWVLPERERLARLYRQCLLRLIDQSEASQQYAEAIVYARRYLAADPLLESAYARLMRLHYAAGDRGHVKEVYEQLVTVFNDELGAEPMEETIAMYEAMLAGKYGATGKTGPLVPTGKSVPPRYQSVSPFVGRISELRWLDDGLAAALAAQGGTYLIEGESGVGKSRLIAEWLQRIQSPAHILSGRGHEFESMIPYSPLAQMLRQAVQAGIPWELFQPPPPWLASLLPLLPDLPSYLGGYPLLEQSGGGQYHVMEGLGSFFLTLARHRLLILYLDNLHWADTPTWNFLGYLAQRTAQSQMLIVGVARAEDMQADRWRLVHKLERIQRLQSLALERLSQEETEELVRQLMPDEQIDPLFLRRIYEETEGNPFFIIETIQAVREAGGDWTESVPTDAAGHRPHFAIPLQVQAVIESRLDKLSQESQAALGVASAIGREFSFELLQEVSQLDTEALLNALDEWLDRGLVRESQDGYDFTHEKLSQVAYQKLSRARRQWVHFQIGQRLSANHTGIDPAQLAHHYYLSSDPGKALPYLAEAGKRALSVRSYAEAREFGLRAIGLFGRIPNPNQTGKGERIDINLQLAQAHAFTGAHGKALKILGETERMAETMGDMGRLARIFHHSAQIFWLRGKVNTTGDYTRRTLRHAEELDDDELRFAALRMLGRVGIVLGSFDDAIAYLLRYIDLAEKGAPPADLPAIYGYLGVAYARVGSWQRAIDAAQKGLDMAKPALSGSMHVVARMQLAYVYAELYEWEQALEIAEPVGGLWREEGMTPYAFMLRTVIGRCLAHLGEPDRGPAEIQAALKWAEEVDYQVQVHVVYLYLAQAQSHSRDNKRAMGTAVKAAELAASVGNRWAEAVALRTQAEIGMRLSKPDWTQIEAKLIKAMEILRRIRARPDLARTYLAMRRLYDRAGQVAWAVDCHFRATTIFEELGMDVERRAAQGQPAGERTGAVVIPGLKLQGPIPQ
jgi:DNA-binding SARP family transcriptional activator